MDEEAFRFLKLRAAGRFFGIGVMALALFLAVQLSGWTGWSFNARLLFWVVGMASCAVGAGLDNVKFNSSDLVDQDWFQKFMIRHQWVVICNAACALVIGWSASALVEPTIGGVFLCVSLVAAMMLGMCVEKVDRLLARARA